MKDTRLQTDWLKGFAIITVVLGHFMARFIPNHYHAFGNHFIAFFFVLSGYGLSCSLGKIEKLSIKSVIKFYIKRFTRIYPLFWTYYFVDILFDKSQHFNMFDFLLLQYTDPQKVWFLNALIPCYLLAPLFYRLFKNNKLLFLSIVVFMFFVSQPISEFISVPYVRCWTYRQLYWGNIFLFSIGMLIPFAIKRFIKLNIYVCFIVGFALIVSFVETSKYSILTDGNDILFSIMFYITTISFVFTFLRNDFFPSHIKFLSKIGKYTFSMYLFEGMYSTLLNKVGFISGYSFYNFIPWFIGYPVFIFSCAILEELFYNKFSISTATRTVVSNFISYERV